jgi:sugar phosphate isomerase/epimerase
VEAADHPALGVCLDSFHVLARRSPLDTIAEIPADKLFFCQLEDAPNLALDVRRWSRHHRCLPGRGAFDLVDFTARVLQAGAGPARPLFDITGKRGRWWTPQWITLAHTTPARPARRRARR